MAVGVERVVAALGTAVVEGCEAVVEAALVDMLVAAGVERVLGALEIAVVEFPAAVVGAAVVDGALTVLFSHLTFSGQSHTCKFRVSIMKDRNYL